MPIAELNYEGAFILIIDDDVFIQMQLRLYLEREGYKIKTANNGQEGLQIYEREKPDLILLDAIMPDMDGFECCRRLMHYEGIAYTPVLIITGLDDKESVDLGYSVGASDYITKPIHWAVLRQRVRRLIHQSRLQKQLEAANKLLESLASIDGLTQVYNRRYFDNCLQQEWLRAAREKQPLTLLLCDVDYFKKYNDNYGHLEGDKCLKQVAVTLHKLVKRPADMVARYGGEEFVILLPKTDATGAEAIAKQLQQAVEELGIVHEYSGASQYVTVSIGGGVIVPSGDEEALKLIDIADKALYEAKKQGRNRVNIEE